MKIMFLEMWSNDAEYLYSFNSSLMKEYYSKEFKFLHEHAKAIAPDGANALAVNSYIIVVNGSSHMRTTRVEANDQYSFIINECLRLRAEMEEVDKLLNLAINTSHGYKWLTYQELLGLKTTRDPQMGYSNEEKFIIRNFQRANHRTITKMKEICVRALIRGIQPPFEWDDSFELADDQRNQGGYKSLFS